MPRPDFLTGGEPARLIPIAADSAREQKSVSVILAGMHSVLELRQSLLKSLGVRVGTSATNSVALFHWSWAFIRTQCQLLLKNDGVEDEDQVFILSEILRYLESDRSGISHFDQMNAEWKDVVNKVKSNATLAKTSDEVQNTIAAWHQE
ncbi:MAG: hypothetical protein ABR522_12890 [Marinobacter sp.]